MTCWEKDDHIIDEEILAKHGKQLQEAIRKQQVDKAWNLWNRIATAFIERIQVTNSKVSRGDLPTIEPQQNAESRNPKMRKALCPNQVVAKALGQAKEILFLIRADWRNEIEEALLANLNKSCDASGIQATISLCSREHEIHEVVKQLEKQRDKHQNITQQVKIKIWKDKMLRNSKQVYKWLREQSPILPCTLPDDKGRPTSDPTKQLNAARKAWEPYLSRHIDDPHDPTLFLREYEEEIAQLATCMEPKKIDKEQFHFTVMNRRAEAAGGADSWKTHEFQRPPRKIIDLLADVLDTGETKGELPKVFSLGITKFLSKGKGIEYLSLRPITLMTVAYASWSTYRGRETAEALEKVLPNNLYGGRKGRSTHSAELPGAIEIELNKDAQEDMLGTSEDYNKCFDTISSKLTIALWKKMGVNPNIVRGIE